MEPLRVLVVEDDVDEARLLLRVFKKGRTQTFVDVVATPQEATAAIARFSYDVIVADARLGTGSGLHVLEHAEQACPKAARILYTARSPWERPVVPKGAHAAWDKDWSTMRLSQALASLLDPEPSPTI